MAKQPAGRAQTAVERAPDVRREPLPRRRRRWPVYLIGFLVLLVVLWLGYWYGATRVAEAAINRAVAAPVAGISFGCPDRSLSGFPLRVDFRCQRATASDARGSLAAALGGFWASAPLYAPGYVTAVLDEPLVLDMPDRGVALTASWTHATASASAWLDGLKGGGAHFTAFSLENGGRSDVLPVKTLEAQTADVSLSPMGSADYRLTANADDVGVIRADGAPLPELDTRANIVAVGVGPLGADPAAAFLRWARSAPSVKIDEFRLAIGDTIVSVTGQLSLSKDGLLNGSILFAYNSIDALGDLIDLFRPGSKTRYAEPLKIVNSLTRSVNTPDGVMRQTSLTFTDGAIWLSIIPLIGVDPIPPIRF
jgi:hypothetical protein